MTLLSSPLRKPACAALLLFACAVVINNHLAPLSAAGAATAGGVTLPLRAARLVFAPPDESLNVPVAGVKAGQVADTWGARRGGGRRHDGQDIFAPRGTPVVSATDGVVVRVGENRLGGQTVSVLGAGGRVYYYAHLNSYAEGLKVGDLVRAGTALGQVGTTGNARGTPPHLHFGVYTPAGSINPLPLLADSRPGNSRK
jgi:peptidoglycan LD-endopeptidase LytH